MGRQQELILRDRTPESPLKRLWNAIHGYTLPPLTSNSPELARYFGDGVQTATGLSVSEFTALNYSAVWAAVNTIASPVAAMPLIIQQGAGDGKRRVDAHLLFRVLHDAPNPDMTSFTFRQTLMSHVLTWGNAYAEIEWRGNGYTRVAGSGTQTILDSADILHFRGLGFDGICGYSVVNKARESIALGIATERFGETFFGNGTAMGGVVTFPGPQPNDGSIENFRDQINKRHQCVDRAHKFLTLYNNATYTRLGIPPRRREFLETRRFQITEIARWFGVPPHKIGDLEKATFSNIEQLEISFVSQSLVPWLRMFEAELTSKLLSSSDRRTYSIEFVVEGLLRGDSAARATFYETMTRIGAMTVNEVRAREGLPPLTGGDGITTITGA